MTLNKINSVCPQCGCKTADVLCKTFSAADGPNKSVTKIIVKCTAKKPHQYSLGPNGKNTEWKKFFK